MHGTAWHSPAFVIASLRMASSGSFLLFVMFWVRWGFVACTRAFSSCGEWGLLLVAVSGLLLAAASLAAEHRLSSCGARA